eukprot:3426697-Amphidinium_carterae.1
MAADSDEESMWDWWPDLEAGLQVTAIQARQTGLLLQQREKKWRATGEPLLSRRDYEEVQDNRTLRDFKVLNLCPQEKLVGPRPPGGGLGALHSSRRGRRQ